MVLVARPKYGSDAMEQTTIDVTGLPAPVIASLRYLVQTLRQSLVKEEMPAHQLPYEEWSKLWHEWVASHKSTNPNFDDSRESIYEGRGE